MHKFDCKKVFALRNNNEVKNEKNSYSSERLSENLMRKLTKKIRLQMPHRIPE